MELLDNGNTGHEKLTQARNELLSLAAQSPNQVTGVRLNGTERYADVQSQRQRRES